jgi:hypothetical protein
MASRARWKLLQTPELLVPDPLVEVRRLESIRVDPGAVATSCCSLGLKPPNETAAPTLASNFFVHPEHAEIEPAIVSISIGAAENPSVSTATPRAVP